MHGYSAMPELRLAT